MDYFQSFLDVESSDTSDDNDWVYKFFQNDGIETSTKPHKSEFRLKISTDQFDGTGKPSALKVIDPERKKSLSLKKRLLNKRKNPIQHKIHNKSKFLLSLCRQV